MTARPPHSGAIFTGAEGGPMAIFAPLITTHLGVKKVPIRYTIPGKTPLAGDPRHHST